MHGWQFHAGVVTQTSGRRNLSAFEFPVARSRNLMIVFTMALRDFERS
jgi:hypothetical protein